MLRAFVFILFLSSFAAAQSVNNEAWLEDFSQMKREMSSHYANLEWAVAERGVDLKALSESTEAKIRSAKSEADVIQALRTFVESFGDGHLQGERPKTQNSNSSEQKAEGLCERLGFRERAFRDGIDFALGDGFRKIDTPSSAYIPARIGTLSDGKHYGILRIPSFSEQHIPSLCRTALAEFNIKEDAECDGECREKVEQKAADLYVDAFRLQLEEVRKAKVAFVIVDVTGNGGGSDVYQPMARMLTKKKLKISTFGFIRHPHWVKDLKERLTDIVAAIPDASPAMQARLRTAEKAVREDLAEAEKTCDLSPLWENKQPGCTNVVRSLNAGVTYAAPGELTDTVLGDLFFTASRYKYAEGLYSGPLFVMIDERSASASEGFTALLRDNGAATVIGTPSLGAGCGYTNGGISTVLKNSKLRLHMPDCVRYRPDGTNEINGITPDVMIPWRRNDTPVQKFRRLNAILPTLQK